MRILAITAGAANMYCGSCLRDNALAAELIAQGHDVTLVPLYTPTLTDEPNVSRKQVFFGGVSVYLEQHLAAFRLTRDDLRRRIDGMMEALRRSHPKRKDATLLATGAGILEDALRPHGFKFSGVREEKADKRSVAVGQFQRRGRSLELQVRSGVGIALWSTGERRMLHPDYMEFLGASPAMRYPGLSRDPIDAFRRLRADVVRFAEPFLTGKGIKAFERHFDERKGAAPAGKTRL